MYVNMYTCTYVIEVCMYIMYVSYIFVCKCVCVYVIVEYQVRCACGLWEWAVTRVQFQMISHFTQMLLFGMNNLEVISDIQCSTLADSWSCNLVVRQVDHLAHCCELCRPDELLLSIAKCNL